MLFGGISVPKRPDPLNIRKLDALPISMILDMQRVGMGFSPDRSHALTTKLEGIKDDLRKQIHSYIPPDRLEAFTSASSDDLNLNVDSAEQIGKLLFDMLGVGVGKRLKTTKTGDRLSTGKKQLETLKRDHPVIPKILEYREASKLQSTYSSAFPKLAVWHRGSTLPHPYCDICKRSHLEGHWRIHGEVVTTRTSTGRLAHRRPNLGNIPTRSPLGREVRALFEAQPGHRLISCDYAQIELRLLAHCAHERRMSDIFHRGVDLHLDTAMQAFNITDPAKVDKTLHRAPCKNVTFGCAYGLGPQGLLELMAVTYATANQNVPDWLDLRWCEDFIDKWFSLYPDAKAYFDHIHYLARKYGIVWTEMGRVRRIPEVRSNHDRVIQAGLRQAGNVPIQGLAADVNKIGMARTQLLLTKLRLDGVEAWPLMTIHDELLTEVEADYADAAEPMISVQMRKAVQDMETGESFCSVPISTDGSSMEVWQKD